MRNDRTGEVTTAHRLGETETGKPIYLAKEGWTLLGPDGRPAAVRCDRDGNWVLRK